MPPATGNRREIDATYFDMGCGDSAGLTNNLPANLPDKMLGWRSLFNPTEWVILY
jgi:hypothetical protein